jgi:putative tricarboxylic transport membrane protein
MRQVAALAILTGYAFLLRPLGFPIATFGLIAGMGIVLGGKPVKAVILGALFAPALWALFDQVLGLPLAVLGSWFG